ncbi:MAG: hypothetical protein ACRDQ7_17835 [Haloechinothrix sp.]
MAEVGVGVDVAGLVADDGVELPGPGPCKHRRKVSEGQAPQIGALDDILVLVLMEILAYMAKHYGFTLRRSAHGAVVKADCSPLALHVDVDDNESWAVSYFCRAEPHWPGDRSDINDIYPTVMQAALWLAGMASCSTVQVPHPAADLPGEIYARYLIPVQPGGSVFRMNDVAFPLVGRFVSNLHVAETTLHTLLNCARPPLNDSSRTFTFRDAGLIEWAQKVSDELFDDPELAEHDNRALRSTDDYEWRYYYSARNGTSAFHAPAIVEKARLVMAPSQETIQTPIPGGTLYDCGGLLGYSSGRLEARAARALRRLEGPTGQRPMFVPLEDCLFVIGRAHFLFLPHRGGAHRYRHEKERLRAWHRDKALDLFGPDEFECVHSRVSWRDGVRL